MNAYNVFFRCKTLWLDAELANYMSEFVTAVFAMYSTPLYTSYRGQRDLCCRLHTPKGWFSISRCRFDYAELDLDSQLISIPSFEFDSEFDPDSGFDLTGILKIKSTFWPGNYIWSLS